MFNADKVEVKESTSKYQKAGVSEKVTITEVILNSNNTLTLKTINEDGQIGSSKRLSLNTVISEGKTMCAWDVSAKYLLNIIQATTGKKVVEAKKVLDAQSIDELVSKLTNELIGKSGRGLFSQREYETGKFAIELYRMEQLGGTYLSYDPTNTSLNKRLPSSVTISDGKTNDLPF